MLKQLNSFYEKQLPVEKCERLLLDYAKTIDGFVLYGANQVGIGLKRTMKKMGLNVLCFLDEYMEFDKLDDLIVLHSIDDIQAKYQKMCFIITASVRTSMKTMTGKLQLAFENCEILNPSVILYCRSNGSAKENGGVYLNEAYFQITNLCTLKCKGCCTLVPNIPLELKNNYPIESLKKDIKSFGEIVSGVTSIYVTGGEPFLHPDLAEVIYSIRENINTELLIINTNATIIPVDEVWNAIKECKVIIRASDYGILSKKHTELLELCKYNDVTVFSRPADAFPWVEYEKMYDRGGTGEFQMEHCREYGCMNIYRGRIYPCFPMIRQHEQHLYKPVSEDYIDLSDELEKRKRKFEDLCKKKTPFFGCKFCGTEYKEIKAATQYEA